ncbi:MAG: cyclic nucleotide-binding domain-containing protein [Mariprofundaceae bacterium]
MNIDFEWLEAQVFQRRLAESERRALEGAITVERFTAGEAILMQNETHGELYLIRSGTVDVLMSFNGEHLKLADCGEGSQIGDMGFLDDRKASASIIAREDCIAYRITRDALSALFVQAQHAARDLTFSMLRDLGTKLRRMNDAHAASLLYIQGRRV